MATGNSLYKTWLITLRRRFQDIVVLAADSTPLLRVESAWHLFDRHDRRDVLHVTNALYNNLASSGDILLMDSTCILWVVDYPVFVMAPPAVSGCGLAD